MTQGLYQKILSKSSYILAIRIAIFIGIFISFSYCSHSLTYEDNRDYQVFWIVANIAAVIGSLAINSIILNVNRQEFLFFFNTFLNKYKWRLSFYVILISSISTLLLYSLSVISFTFYSTTFTIILVLVYTLTFGIDQIFLIFERYKTQLFINVLFSILWVLSHILIIKHFPNNLVFLFGALIIPTILKLVIQSLLLRKYLHGIDHIHVSESRVKDLSRLWRHLGLHEVIQFVFKYFDKLFLSFVVAKSVAAIYFVGRQDIPLLPNVLAAIVNASLLSLSQGAQSNDDYRATLFHSSKMSATITFAAISFFYFYSEELITLIFSGKYITAVPIFTLSLLLLPAQYCFLSNIVLVHKAQGKTIVVGAIIDIVITILLSIILFYIFNDSSVLVISLIIGTYAQSIYYLYKTSVLLNTSTFLLLPYKNWIIKIISFGIIGFIMYHATAMIDHKILYVSIGLLTLGIACILWLWKENKNA